ncbi:membrane cofactor protein-like [Mercenaria mercenaria]|uniref:membrane cofactor protein-like n=1 Tax=Mercenaria mercenaria TaxID=6596 RepID=UPI00234E5381|nr:membrane cofactor protein-like [Mercenaria mercenaria]
MEYIKAAKVLKGIVLIYACFVTVTRASYNDSTTYDDSTNITDCGPVPNITHGVVQLQDEYDTLYGALAYVLCDRGFETNITVLTCLDTGDWEDWETFASCEPIDCGEVPYIDNGNTALVDSNNSTYRAQAIVNCDPGYSADKSYIKCLSSGNWDDNVTINECDVNNIPVIANGEVILNTDSNQTIASLVNVSCNNGFAATSPVVACMGQGVWQDNVTCTPYVLGIVKVETGQDIANGQHFAYFRCVFNIAVGLKYRIKWYKEHCCQINLKRQSKYDIF